MGLASTPMWDVISCGIGISSSQHRLPLSRDHMEAGVVCHFKTGYRLRRGYGLPYIFFHVGSMAPNGVASALSPRLDERIWNKGFLRLTGKRHDGSEILIFGLIFGTMSY